MKFILAITKKVKKLQAQLGAIKLKALEQTEGRPIICEEEN